MLRDDFDAVFIGALGDPRVPDNRHARDILLGTRFELDLYVNYRPVRLLDNRLCPLKDRTTADVDFVVFRENTEGLYVGIGGRFKAGTEDEVAIQEELNTYKGVHRIIRHAFEFARANGRRTVCMSDKSNAMVQGTRSGSAFGGGQFPEIQARHLHRRAGAADGAGSRVEVIVTNNLSATSSPTLACAGRPGVAASGNLHPGGPRCSSRCTGLRAARGEERRNPMGAILSSALLIQSLGLIQEAATIEAAVKHAVVTGNGTKEIGGSLGTRETGDFIADAVESMKG
jgi:3-isopropylmalate dehydrogenase